MGKWEKVDFWATSLFLRHVIFTDPLHIIDSGHYQRILRSLEHEDIVLHRLIAVLKL